MSETPKSMSSKRNIIILVIVLAEVIVGGIHNHIRSHHHSYD